jgi:hypothetical protein
MWNSCCFHFETVLVSVQDRCMVCARRTIGSEILLDAPSLGDMGHVESLLFSFGDSASVSAT